MEKKLPSVFANTIDKPINNNNKIYKGTNQEQTTDQKEPKLKYEKNINQKIDDIFKSKKYIYKIPVKITTNNEEMTKYIIGKNTKNLITIDNELIELNQIKDITVIEQEKNE